MDSLISQVSSLKRQSAIRKKKILKRFCTKYPRLSKNGVRTTELDKLRDSIKLKADPKTIENQYNQLKLQLTNIGSRK